MTPAADVTYRYHTPTLRSRVRVFFSSSSNGWMLRAFYFLFLFFIHVAVVDFSIYLSFNSTTRFRVPFGSAIEFLGFCAISLMQVNVRKLLRFLFGFDLGFFSPLIRLKVWCWWMMWCLWYVFLNDHACFGLSDLVAILAVEDVSF